MLDPFLKGMEKAQGPRSMFWNSWFMFWTSGIPDFLSAKTQLISPAAVRLGWNLADQGGIKGSNTFCFRKLLIKYLEVLQLSVFLAHWHTLGRIPILFSLNLPFLSMERNFKPVHKKAILFYKNWWKSFKFGSCPAKVHTFKVCAKK